MRNIPPAYGSVCCFWVAAPLQPLAFAENGVASARVAKLPATFLGAPSGGAKIRRAHPCARQGQRPLAKKMRAVARRARERYRMAETQSGARVRRAGLAPGRSKRRAHQFTLAQAHAPRVLSPVVIAVGGPLEPWV